MSQKKTPTSRLRSTTPSPSFKKFLDAGGKSKSPLLKSIERHLLSKPRDLSRRTDVLHPSEIVGKDWCYRASYFLLKGAEPAPKTYSMKTQVTFAEGHAIHDKWQRWIWEMGALYGRWKCLACPYSWMGVSPSNCPICQSPNIKYNEVPVFNDELHILGHSDGWIVGVTEKPLLLEIKSMGPGSFIFEDMDAWKAAEGDYEKAWKNFSTPFVKHQAQAQLYLKLLEDQPDAPESIVFIYESKPNQQVKEFHVNKSSLLVDPILDAARMIASAVKNDTPPACNVSRSWNCSKCEVYK